MIPGSFSRYCRVFAAAAALLTIADAAVACSGRLHVEVAESGVYGLDYDTVIAAQPALKDCRATDLVLLHKGEEIPIRVVDDGHGAFAAGSRIEWVGEALHGPQSWFDPYSNVNVYQLAAVPGAHARLREIAAPTAKPAATLRRRLHLEQENLMIRLGSRDMKTGDEPDVWQWAKLTPIDAQPFVVDFDLDDLNASTRGASVTLTLDMRGESNIAATPKPADHRVEVLINGSLVQTLEWDGRDEIRRTLSVPAASLKAKGNQLSLRVPRREAPDDAKNFIIDVVMFNWLEAEYPLSGEFGPDTAAFRASSSAPIEFTYAGATAPVVFGSDGTLRLAGAAGTHWRVAGATDNVDLYPFAGQPRKPALVRAVADTDLRASSGFDYLMVAHPRLLAAIEPLAQYHNAHGHRVSVVNVDDIYDQFGGGIIHPAAIRDFVAWGVEHWQIKPRFLLLVGDASVDIHHDIRQTGTKQASRNAAPAAVLAPRAHLRASDVMVPGGFAGMDITAYKELAADLPNRNLIPTWQTPSSGEGQSASDVPYVAIKPGDFHPQLAVGRLPVVEPEEVRAIVKKTLAYLTDATPGRWRHDMTFISTSEVDSFKKESDRLASDLENQGFAVHSLYTDFNEKDPARVKALRAALKQNLDDGSVLVHFLGHGGNYIWRVGPMGDLFALDDVAAMKNAGRYPLVMAMTCFSAPFDNPVADSIGERFLREADKGAIAVFGASWSNSPNPAYSRALIEQALQPGASIGEAITRAKAKVGDRVFVEMYNLLGDPAVVLARPQAELRIEPVANRWDRRLIVQLPMSEFGGTVDVDWVDALGGIVMSRRYQARDRQFYLDMPATAEKVIAYAADTRNGAQAFGGYSIPKPAPVVAPAKPAPPPAPQVAFVAPVAPVAAKPATPAPKNQPDRIAKSGFDAPAPAPAAAPDSKRSRR